MKPKVALVLAAWTLVLGAIAGTPSVSADSQTQQSAAQPNAAQRCFERHKFGAQPVDVAKTADGQTVLAQTIWGWHDSIGCYLSLDDKALAVLRAAPPPQSLPDTETEASQRCFERHKFGAQPVDVAKTADGQTVLARLIWGWHDSIGCYLILDNTALTTLRTPTPTDTDDTGIPLNITAIPGYYQITATWTAPDSTDLPPGTRYLVAYKANATPCPTDIDIREWTWDSTGMVHFSYLTWDYIETSNTEVTISAPSIGTPYLVCVASNSPIAGGTWATAIATPRSYLTSDELLVKEFGTTDLVGSEGNLRVQLHFCVRPELAHFFAPTDIATTVDMWNELEAPFYSWQSSGLLNMRMEAGRIIESTILRSNLYEDWRHGVAPVDCIFAALPAASDCLTTTMEDSPELCIDDTAKQSGIIHHFYVFSDADYGPSGRATLNGYTSGTFISENNLKNSIEHPKLFFDITSHELDHNLGIVHNNGSSIYGTFYPYDVPIHRTRGRINPEIESNLTIGTLAGQPSNLAQAYSPFNSNIRVGYYCYDVRDLGWPMGDDEPACVRAHPANRSDLDVEVTADGRVSVSWGESSFPRNHEPVSAYRIELEQLKTQEYGRVGWTLVSSHTLDASATSFVTPPQPVGRYRIKLLLSWTLEDDFFLSVGPPDVFNIYLTVVSPTAKVNQIPNLNTWYGDIRDPIEYELEWEPAPGASYYEVSGFANCLYESGSREWFQVPDGGLYGGGRCHRVTTEPNFSLSEMKHEIQEGKSYDIMIAACYPDHNDCHVWTTATINAQRFGSEANLRISYGTQWGLPGYLFEWEHNPGASHYRLWIGECPDDSSTCSPRSRTILTWEPNETAFVYMRDGILDYGKRYLAELYYCPPGAEIRDCIPWTETTFTTQARDN